ncbi:MAG TPA: pyridoxamine 5'-phosphate oxidase family protein [Candidatus Saccharimonadia bacterium]|nr:pyridoxamine 5'-phosphate oxidase family protein [Candidatus Saccharimonadia bacterium]
MTSRNEILAFIKKQSIAVISTIDGRGLPQSAVVGFGETEELELIFATYNSTPKYENLKRRKQVAFVIGWDDGVTVQYEGIARELRGEEARTYSNMYYAKNQGAQKYQRMPENRYFLVSPVWLRYTDVDVDPWDIAELEFPAAT